MQKTEIFKMRVWVYLLLACLCLNLGSCKNNTPLIVQDPPQPSTLPASLPSNGQEEGGLHLPNPEIEEPSYTDTQPPSWMGERVSVDGITPNLAAAGTAPTYQINDNPINLVLEAYDDNKVAAYLIKEIVDNQKVDNPTKTDTLWIKLNPPARTLQKLKIPYQIQNTALKPPYARLMVWLKDEKGNISEPWSVYLSYGGSALSVLYTQKFVSVAMDANASGIVPNSLAVTFDENSLAHVVYIKDNSIVYVYEKKSGELSTPLLYPLTGLSNSGVVQTALVLGGDGSKNIVIGVREVIPNPHIFKIYLIKIKKDNSVTSNFIGEAGYCGNYYTSLPFETRVSSYLGCVNTLVPPHFFYIAVDANKKISLFFMVFHKPGKSVVCKKKLEPIEDLSECSDFYPDEKYQTTNTVEFLWNRTELLFYNYYTGSDLSYPIERVIVSANNSTINKKIAYFPKSCTGSVYGIAHQEEHYISCWDDQANTRQIIKVAKDGTVSTYALDTYIPKLHFFLFNRQNKMLYLVPDDASEVIARNATLNRLASVIIKDSKLVFRYSNY